MDKTLARRRHGLLGALLRGCSIAAIPLVVAGTPTRATAQPTYNDLQLAASRLLDMNAVNDVWPQMSNVGGVLRFAYFHDQTRESTYPNDAMEILLYAQSGLEALRRYGAQDPTIAEFWRTVVELGSAEVERAFYEVVNNPQMGERTLQHRAAIARGRIHDALFMALWDYATANGLRLEFQDTVVEAGLSTVTMTVQTQPPGGTVDLVLAWDYYAARLRQQDAFSTQGRSSLDRSTLTVRPGGYMYRVRWPDGQVYGPENRILGSGDSGPFGYAAGQR